MTSALRSGLVLVLWLWLAPVQAWHQEGHEAIARHAVALLPADVPEFFRAGADQVAFGAMDADLFKHPALPELTRTESPEHFVNLELLEGAELPATRRELARWLQRRGLSADQLGLLPYAVVEWTQRLAVAFAEHRHWPADERAQAKALVYAGMLAHYSGDLAMPLHTSVHYDGRRRADGSSPRTGLHQRLDALLDKLPVNDPSWVAGLQPRRYGDDLLGAVYEEIAASHARVARVYELEAQIPALSSRQVDAPAVRELGRESFRHGVVVTASLFLTAWELSGDISLPRWRMQRQNDLPAAESN